MVSAQLLQIRRIVGHYQVMPDPGAYEDPFYSGNSSDPAQEVHLTGMIFIQRRTICRAEFIRARSMHPARAGEGVHVGSRPAHIGYDSFEAIHPREPGGLAQDGVCASALDDPALVVGESTK